MLGARGTELLGHGRDRALLVQRRRDHRHGQARGEQHAGDAGRLDGLFAADGRQDDAVRGGRHGEQAGTVGAGETGLGEPHVQRFGEQRVRSEHIGQLGRDLAVHHGLPDPAQQRVVRPGEQRHDDRDGTLGLLDVQAGGAGLLEAGGALLGGPDEHGGQGGELGVVVPVEVTDAGVEPGQLGTGDADDLVGEAAGGTAGRPRHREDERRRALGSHQGFGTTVPSGLAGARHSYGQAGRGPSGGAHGAACYWFPGAPSSGRVQVSGIRPVLSDE